MRRLQVFVSGILGGMCIAFGGTVFLSLDNKVIGSLLFSLGLFVVCTFGFHLFTGRVGYVFFRGKDYAIDLPFIWVGNIIGTGIVSAFVHATRITGISEKAADMCATKANDSLLSLFVLGILCNIFMYIAVESYAGNPHQVGKYLGLVMGVMVFILSGTEHCVADMYYFWVGRAWTARTILCIIVISLGNAVGGVMLPLGRKFITLKKDDNRSGN